MWAAEAFAQLPAGELRLWLKADSLSLTEDARVTQWVDSSPHGTIFAPRTTSEPDGPLGNFPVEEHPHLQTITLNGHSFKSVKFERDGDIFNVGNPAVDRSGSTDRLYQVNNRTPGSDPLVIADGTSMTSFTVLKPNVTVPNSLGFQAIWALRGNNASLLELGISGGNPNTAGRFNYVTYDATTSYVAAVGPGTDPQPAGKWHILHQTITESGANDLLSFASNHTENPLSPLAPLLPVTNGGLIVDRNDGINDDPAGLVEPFGIGGHAQDCCGEGETFAGNIAEIIIYARALSSPEMDQVYSYLNAKYFGAPPAAVPGDYNENSMVDAADYVVWRNNIGQFFGLANENSAAATEGFVDSEDYDYWRSRFGTTGGNGAGVAAAVPEPTSALLAALVGLVAAIPTRRRS
jgi:hypothetical protein